MAKLLEIITNPNETLRKKSENVKKDDINKKVIQELCNDMTKTMNKKDGIGLAAPQIGKNIRLIIINSKDGILTMFDPRISKKSFFQERDIEGCLSVPYTFGSVRRNKKITCCFLDKKGEEQKIKAEGLLARVMQHEIDHLDGILFIDKAKDIKEIRPEDEKRSKLATTNGDHPNVEKGVDAGLQIPHIRMRKRSRLATTNSDHLNEKKE